MRRGILAAAVAIGLATTSLDATEYTLKNLKDHVKIEELSSECHKVHSPAIKDYSEIKSIIGPAYKTITGDTIDCKVSILERQEFEELQRNQTNLKDDKSYNAFLIGKNVYARQDSLVEVMFAVFHELGHYYSNGKKGVIPKGPDERLADETKAIFFTLMGSAYIEPYIGARLNVLYQNKKGTDKAYPLASQIVEKFMDRYNPKTLVDAYKLMMKQSQKKLASLVRNTREYREYIEEVNERNATVAKGTIFDDLFVKRVSK